MATADTGTASNPPADGDASSGTPPLRRKPMDKQPPSLKMTVIVLGVMFLFMNPSVRWRASEFNLYIRTCLPYGGNPPFGVRPGGGRPERIIIESRFGANSELMSGQYYLRKEKLHGRSTWFKNAPGQEGYLVWDYCDAWLISRFPDGNSPKCEGWAYTNRCYGMPWDCDKSWNIREDGRWDNAGASVTVTPVYGEVPKSMPRSCSEEEEKNLEEKASLFDVVIPWINGSDPEWLGAREKTCEEWQWHEMWKDAVRRSPGTAECLAEPESIQEAVKASGERASRGLVSRSSRCFRRFVDSHCTGRLNSIKDHDELRYLLRSFERHLPWHRGKIYIIAPKNMVPAWLKPGGKLEVIAQEELLQKALLSSSFVAARARGRTSEWAPDRIFNDYPLQAVLAFLPTTNRVLMLLQDDLLFGRPVSICDFFTSKPVGLKLFARPFDGLTSKDPYAQIYESMELWTSKKFQQFGKTKDGIDGAYHRDLHLPHMLDMHLLEDLWRDFPVLMSDAVSSAFRQPNLTNVIALHHSEAARRSQKRLSAKEAAKYGHSGEPQRDQIEQLARQLQAHFDTFVAYLRRSPLEWKNAFKRLVGMQVDTPQESAHAVDEGETLEVEESSDSLDLKTVNLVMNLSGAFPVSQRPWMEVVFESLNDWHDKMAKVPPDPKKLPAIIGLQDNFGANMDSAVAELDCLREKWLNKLLPGPSSYEDPDVPPGMCRSWKQSRGVAQGKAKPRAKQAKDGKEEL